MLTDIESQVPLLSQNLTTNSSQIGRRATVLPLDWTLPVSTQVKGWIRSGVDYIIASDVIYADELVESLVSTLYSCSTPNTTILLSYGMSLPTQQSPARHCHATTRLVTIFWFQLNQFIYGFLFRNAQTITFGFIFSRSKKIF